MRPIPLLSASIFALAATLTLGQSAPSQAQPAHRTARTPAAPQIPSQLPRNARPLHYTIAVTPEAEHLRFTGRVEIDWLNGEVVRLAESLGETAPVNAAIVELVKQAELGVQRTWGAKQLCDHILGGHRRVKGFGY